MKQYTLLGIAIILGVIVTFILWPPPSPPKPATVAPRAPEALPPEAPTFSTPSPVAVATPPEETSPPRVPGYQSHFAHFREEYGANAIEVKGRAKVKYRGVRGQFEFLALLPPPAMEEASVAFYLFPVGQLGTDGNFGGVPPTSRTPQEVVFSIPGISIRSYFIAPGKESEGLDGITDVYFRFDPRKPQGTGELTARTDSDATGTPEKIGRFEYSARPSVIRD